MFLNRNDMGKVQCNGTIMRPVVVKFDDKSKEDLLFHSVGEAARYFGVIPPYMKGYLDGVHHMGRFSCSVYDAESRTDVLASYEQSHKVSPLF